MDSGLEDVKRQLATIESRLNRILDLINPPVAPTKAVATKVVATEAVVAETGEGEVLPKKVRKPKTVKTEKAIKKVAKKAAPKVSKKVAKKIKK
jgi:hypothetical protein